MKIALKKKLYKKKPMQVYAEYIVEYVYEA